MNTINESLIRTLFPKVTDAAGVVVALAIIAEKYEINTPQRLAQFLAQVTHESAGLTTLTENLNYGAEGLVKTFSKYFKAAEAKNYERKPERIANRVYANRMGNGNEESGEGYRYRGRGAIQLTGKDNYKAATASLGVDFVSSPDLVAKMPHALTTAGWFWNSRSLNALADKSDHIGVCKKINGGLNGLDDRIAQYNRILPKLG